MKKIISLSIEENILKEIDEKRGIVTRSKFIELIITLWVINQMSETVQTKKELEKTIQTMKAIIETIENKN